MNLTGYAGDTVWERYGRSVDNRTDLIIFRYSILILAVFNVFCEIFRASKDTIIYLTTIENILEICLYLSTITFIIDIYPCQYATGYRADWQWNFGAVAIVLGWIEIVIYIRQLHHLLGIYFVMFKDVLYTFIKCFVVFFFFIVAFGMGFFCLVQNQTPFAKPWLAILRTAVMMIGEFDYNNIFYGKDEMHYWLTYVLMVVFVVVMSIIIMNLMVGLAVDDIKGVAENAKFMSIAMKIRFLLNVEKLWLRFTRRYYRQFYKGRKDYNYENKDITPEEQIKKTRAMFLKKLDKVESNVSRIEEMLGKIMRAQNINSDPDNIPA